MSSLRLILIVCILQVVAYTQAGLSPNPSSSQTVETLAIDNADAIKLFSSGNQNQELYPEQTRRLLSTLAAANFGANKGGIRSEDSIRALIEVSNTSAEKCDINSMVHLRNQMAYYKSLKRYVSHFLAIQVYACKEKFSEWLRQLVSDISDDMELALDKISDLSGIVVLLRRDEIIHQALYEGRHRQQFDRLKEESVDTAIDSLLIDIPQNILERGLATYLSGKEFVSSRKKTITDWIHEEFAGAIEMFNSHLGELKSLYQALKLAAPDRLNARYDKVSKVIMINFQLADMLSESRFNAANLAKWMPKKENTKGFMSRLCVGTCSIKE